MIPWSEVADLIKETISRDLLPQNSLKGQCNKIFDFYFQDYNPSGPLIHKLSFIFIFDYGFDFAE